MVFDKPIAIQKINSDSEQWETEFALHARVNKSAGSEIVNAGAIQSRSTLTFEVRYFSRLENIDADRGSYRIVYRDRLYNITDYDDYMQSHKTVKLTGISYG